MTHTLTIGLIAGLLLPGQRGASTGTAVIAGTIVAAEDGRTPIRRVRVTLSAVDRSFGDTVIAGDDGAFRFEKLPAGRYLLGAIKPAYVRTNYGETRPGRAGTPIAIANGEARTDIVFPLTRGAVLGGTVLDATGEPAVGEVLVYRRVTDTRWDEVTRVDLDDRGVYRAFGLRAGDYKVATQARVDAFGTRALEVPGQGDAVRRTALGYAPTFYPGTTTAAEAAVITLKPGEERNNLDHVAQLVLMSRVSGTVVDPDGGDLKSAMIFMVSSTGGDPGGGPLDYTHDARGSSFHFEGVAPGEYLIGVAVRAGEATAKWASAKVSANGSEVTGLVLTLQRGFSVSGRIVTEGPKVEARLPTFQLKPLPGSERLVVGAYPEPPAADGSFSLHGLAAGRFQLLAHDEPPEFPRSWSLKSVVINGKDVAHRPIEISGDVRDVVLTFTSQVTALSGELQDASGRPAADYHIVVFPSEREAWLAGSARLRTTRPGTHGSYLFKGLPAGDYWIAALTDVEPDEWQDSAFLEQLIAGAVRITLTEGEKKTQDIRIAK
jgi:hypothetical protein